MTGGIEDIGYQNISVVCQLPILGIFLAVEIGLGTEDGHLLALVPESSLVIAVADTGTHKTIDIISVRRTADVDVRLPDVATRCSMTMLHHILALIIDLVVAGKMSMAAEEFTQAMNGVRQFNRLEGIDLKSYQCETIFVDPPRSGLDSETEKMVQAYPRILYISCNPETLCKNLETLSQTHKVERLALFDQFPYTHHMECGVLLTAR